MARFTTRRILIDLEIEQLFVGSHGEFRRQVQARDPDNDTWTGQTLVGRTGFSLEFRSAEDPSNVLTTITEGRFLIVENATQGNYVFRPDDTVFSIGNTGDWWVSERLANATWTSGLRIPPFLVRIDQ